MDMMGDGLPDSQTAATIVDRRPQNSFMNFEPPTNLMDSSFFEAVSLEDVGNMLFV
jgi:hypothetical protein